ncbi:phosphatase PAP2 family protein [Hymenobacter sp. PAMC 26628]|uniref:phosphatase PAP2 family protein n=1 Tax=Hymenobacter sp. PAMC 26628 TaxID=1484118 RepID=UPI00077011AC|nr:phosphatase PAP2 family protein [Hymenobacter sp. PAMC 26628]AMJ64343.1 hypothetical protein AXW84_02045 [Hymenobacter sp. PAMC 26628]
MLLRYPHRRGPWQRLALPLTLLFALGPAAAAPAPRPDSVAVPHPAVLADTIRPAAAGPPADSLPAKPGHARRTDYMVAPGVTWHYEKPRPFQWLYHIPRDVAEMPGYAFKKKNVPVLAGIVGSSAVLFAFDQLIIDGVQRGSRGLGITAEDKQRNLFRLPFHVGSINLPIEYNAPDNFNTSLYFLGDGWTHLTIASSFLAYGIFGHDNRALQTSSQLGEAILTTGLATQLIKHLTGRQSPNVSTKPRGEWDLLPNYNDYQNAVPQHDAFPTGHLATAMATVTVIADNYPEYRFIRPVGYGLMTVLGAAMLNNGVHWASDYPLGIALGYGFAKIAVAHGRTRLNPVTGLARPRPWYRQAQPAPFVYGPFTGASLTWRW